MAILSRDIRNIRSHAAIALVIGVVLACVGPASNALSSHPTALSEALVTALEGRVARAVIEDWSKVSGLVVPCGAPSRVIEAMRLARVHPHLRILLSGPGGEERNLALEADGVDPSRVMMEYQSLNTFGNAQVAKKLINPGSHETWLLVTSASHMPRALGSFQRVGFHVKPWPVSDRPTSSAAIAAVAWHEWVGLVSYWVRGRTISLLPDDAATGGIMGKS